MPAVAEKQEEGTVTLRSYEATEKQQEFNRSPQRFKLFGGAMGGGKSRCLSEYCHQLAMDFAGNRVLLLRKVLADFKISTYLILLKTLNPWIEAGAVRENKAERYFEYLHNKSRLYYGGLDIGTQERRKFFSSEWGAIAVDEAREMTEKEFLELGSRLRHGLPSGKFPPFFMLLASNPSQNWLKNYFILNPSKDYVFIPALPRDNPHNPPDYEAQLRDLFHGDEKFVSAYIEGSWDAVGSIDDLLLMTDLEPCIRYSVPREMYNRRITVCDFARYGDDETVIYDFCNEGVVGEENYGKKGTGETVGRLIYHQQKNHSVLVGIDPIGEGAGAFDQLTELANDSAGLMKFAVMGIDFRARSNFPGRFKNLRAEIYWMAREKIQNRRCSIPKDFQLHGQLCGIKYKFVPGSRTQDEKGNIFSAGVRIQIEAKEEVKKRLGRSPDKADAYVMGLYVVERAKSIMNVEKEASSYIPYSERFTPVA